MNKLATLFGTFDWPVSKTLFVVPFSIAWMPADWSICIFSHCLRPLRQSLLYIDLIEPLRFTAATPKEGALVSLSNSKTFRRVIFVSSTREF